MKKKLITIIFTLFLITIGLTALANTGENNGYDPVTYDDSINFTATLNEDGSVTTTWSKYAHPENFSFYKVVRSQEVENPVYPDNGYIKYTSNIDELSYTDKEVPEGTNYYRVCQIASPKRYCSKTVVKINKSSNQATEEETKNEEQKTEETTKFKDLDKSHWAYSCVENLSNNNIIKGYNDGTFGTNNPITRAEFIKILMSKFFNDKIKDTTEQCFKDINSPDWYKKYVCSAKTQGITSGYPDNTFHPNSPITRAEAVSALLKALKVKLQDTKLSSFVDVIIDWQIPYIETAKKYNLVKGYTDNTFKPNSDITRAESAVIICNTDGKTFEKDNSNNEQEESVENTENTNNEENDTAEDEENTNENTDNTTIPTHTNAIIIDHNSTNISEIPTTYIEKAKNTFKIAYGHTSHGSQLTTGMQTLRNEYGDLYAFSSNGENGLYYNEDLLYGDLGHNGDLDWADQTRDLLNDNTNNINMVMWSWCGGQSDNTEEGVNTYLNEMNKLEQEYPNVTFIYMTGHLDGTGEDGNLHKRNEQIRNYVKEHNKILYDFADIESYDPSGTTNFMTLLATDGNDYDKNGDGNPWGDGNWSTEWCSANPESDLCTSNSCAHSTSLNCNLKGRAFWYMLARLAGWQA